MRLLVIHVLLFFTLIPFSFGQGLEIEALQKSLDTSTVATKRVRLLSDIGAAYFSEQIYFDSAIYYNEKSLQLARNSDLEEVQARPLFWLGIINSRLKNHEKAIDYYEKSLIILDKFGRSGQVGAAYTNIGGSYFELERYHKALQNYEKALKIATKDQDTLNMGIDYMNIGEVYGLMDNHQKSKEMLELSLGLLSKTDVDPPTVHLFYARTLFNLGNLDDAEAQASQALHISEADSDLYYINESATLLSNIYEIRGDFAKAFQYQKIAKKSDDSLNTSMELNEIEKMNLNFELQKKEEELAFIKQENTYQNIIYLLVGLGVVLLVVLIFRQRKIIRLNQEMRDVQKRLIEGELHQRESSNLHHHATGFDAAIEQDKELQ